MQHTNADRGQAIAAVAIAVAAIALVAVVSIGAGTPAPVPGDPSPTPSSAPSTPPSVPPTAEPSVAPSVAPSAPVDRPVTVDLDIATDHDVTVTVTDETGDVSGVGSGRAGDGMSVRWFDVTVENVDADSVKVTWVGLPIDESVDLTITATDGGYVFDFFQDAPPANSDAIGFDRVLVIDFASPVDAGDIEVSFPKPTPA